MDNIDLQSHLASLTPDELIALQKDIEKRVKDYHKNLVLKTKQEVLNHIKTKSLSFDDLFGDGAWKQDKYKVKVPAKYRDSENPNNSWSGRGKQPNWVKDYLAKGYSLDSILVKE